MVSENKNLSKSPKKIPDPKIKPQKERPYLSVQIL
jgi:hypothetical protein